MDPNIKFLLRVLVFMLATLVWLQACRPKAPEPDPCAGKHPVTADFHIYEEFYTPYPDGWELYDTDTVATGGVRFVALERNAQYEWRLGSQTITEKSFYREDFPKGAHISVSLRVTKTPDRTCFPEDSGVVINTRKFYTTTGDCQFPAFKGRFRGYRSGNPNQSVILEMQDCFRPPDQKPSDDRVYLRIINLEPNCDAYSFIILRAYKQFSFAAEFGVCNRSVGIMRIHGVNNDSLTVKYSAQKDPLSTNTDRISKTFRSIRISN